MKKAGTADEFFASAKAWKKELATLRTILRSTGLEETVKWGIPVYVRDGVNVVGVGAFKSYFGLWFYQGALLADPERLLVNAQAGKTKALRQMRFQAAGEVDRKTVKAYVAEAIDLARRGAKVAPDRNEAVTVPPELEAALRTRRKARTAFDALTPGKRREYAAHVADARRDETKQKRIEKILPMIEAGVGLNDRYRSC